MRVDTHVFEGYVVPPDYDSLLAKLVVHGSERAEAIDELGAALDQLEVSGIDTNVDMHRAVIGHPDFVADRLGHPVVGAGVSARVRASNVWKQVT